MVRGLTKERAQTSLQKPAPSLASYVWICPALLYCNPVQRSCTLHPALQKRRSARPCARDHFTLTVISRVTFSDSRLTAVMTTVAVPLPFALIRPVFDTRTTDRSELL